LLHGIVLDTIIVVGALRPNDFYPAEIMKLLIDWRNDVACCSSDKRYIQTGQPMVDVFYHTMTMANMSNFLANPLEEYHKFDGYLLNLATRSGYLNKNFKARKLASIWPSRLVTWESIMTSEVLSAFRASVHRRLVRTKRGYLGLVHGQVQIGDKVALFRGGSLPLIIRKHGDIWRIVGDGYVHGVMMGEAFEDSKCEEHWFS
jgi:hypothetical protein